MSELYQYDRKFSLKAPEGVKRTVLYFYPRDNTPGCTTEAKDFTKALPRFQKLGARVLGVSQDSLTSHERFRDKQALRIGLVSDPDGELCQKFGVIQEKSLYGRKFMGIVRSTFVLDEKGKVLKEWTKVKVAGHVDEVLEFLVAEKKTK
jgi:peroxiredoxin Q/BCP